MNSYTLEELEELALEYLDYLSDNLDDDYTSDRATAYQVLLGIGFPSSDMPSFLEWLKTKENKGE